MYLQIDDALGADLERLAAKSTRTASQLAELVLRRFGTFAPTDRALVLTGQILQDLEGILAGGQIKDPQDLKARVERWAGITLGGVRLQFSEAQLEEIALRAEKQGRSPQVLCEEIIQGMSGEFFNNLRTLA